MIRRAERKDIPEIVQISLEYYSDELLKARSGIPIDRDSVEILVRLHMVDRARCCFVNEIDGRIVGVVYGIVTPWPANVNTPVAQETLCWGDGFRELRDEFDVWALERGSMNSMISCFTKTEEDRFRILQEVK